MEWLFAKWKTFETSRNAHFNVQNKRQSSVCCFCVKGKSWGIAREKLNISAKRNVQYLVRIVKEMLNIWTLRQGEIQCSMFVWGWNAKHLNTLPPPPPPQREPVSSFAPARQTEYVIIIKSSSSSSSSSSPDRICNHHQGVIIINVDNHIKEPDGQKYMESSSSTPPSRQSSP